MSQDDAALDFGTLYNMVSILANKEYITNVYKINLCDGSIAYSYTEPKIGDSKSCVDPGMPSNGEEIVARAHTHAAFDTQYRNNEFSGETSTSDGNLHSSDGDVFLYNMMEVDGYVATPNGSLRKYEHLTGKVTIISEQMPSDFRDMSAPKFFQPIDFLNNKPKK